MVPASPQHVEAEVTLIGGWFGIEPCLMEVWTFLNDYLWLDIDLKDITTHQGRTSIIACRHREPGVAHLQGLQNYCDQIYSN